MPNKRFRVQAGVCAVFALVASVGLCCTNGPAGATAGPSNNFGSDNTVGDISNAIYLNDGRYVDWSLWWNYIGNWNLQQLSIIINVVEAGTEYYEPTDLHVTRGADRSTQDVIVVPVNANPNDIAITGCRIGLPGLTIYGSHHHRVCDRKQITIYNGTWSHPLAVEVNNIVAHEMGHAIVLRHSNAPCPDIAGYCRGVSTTGVPQWNTHNAPGTDSLMWQGLGTTAATSLNLQDVGEIQAHY